MCLSLSLCGCRTGAGLHATGAGGHPVAGGGRTGRGRHHQVRRQYPQGRAAGSIPNLFMKDRRFYKEDLAPTS